MNRKEFIDRLRNELSKLPADEVNAAVEYYEEYFDEAGPEKEQEIIRELGSPKKVAAQIKSEYAVKMLDAEQRPTAKKGLSAVWWIIIGICSAPISIPLAFCLVVAAIGLFITAICCIIGVFAAIIGCAAGAIACLVFGFLAIPVAFPTALLGIGIGLCGLGVLAALSVAIVIGLRAAITSMVRAMRRRNERKRFEKMNSASEQKKWKYDEEQSTLKDIRSAGEEPTGTNGGWKYKKEQADVKEAWSTAEGAADAGSGWEFKGEVEPVSAAVAKENIEEAAAAPEDRELAEKKEVE